MDNPAFHASVMAVTANEYPFPGNPHYFDTVFYGQPPVGGWPLNFAVLTASCPCHNRHATDEENTRANAKLRATLEAHGFQPFRVTGAAPDLSHREEGWGFTSATLEIAAKLCADFDQDAYFWIEDGEIFLAKDASGRGWRVASWKERLRPGLTPRPATDGMK